jgi:hypothetical protein
MKLTAPIVVAAALVAAPAHASTKHAHGKQTSDAQFAAPLQKDANAYAAKTQPEGDGYRKATPYEQTKAVCEMFADGRPMPGYFVAGNSTFVGATTFAYGLGSMIRHARAYDQCMVMHSYVHQ